MEQRLTTYLLQYLLDHEFKSKEKMARELEISKRVLQRLLNDPDRTKGGSIALEKAICYCVRNNIPIDPIFRMCKVENEDDTNGEKYEKYETSNEKNHQGDICIYNMR